MEDLTLRLLEEPDIETIAPAYRQVGWDRPTTLYERYLSEQERGERIVLVALLDGDFAGEVGVMWRSDYPPFRERGIPEIKDFNVVPGFRRRGIGTRLMVEIEARIAARSRVAGIGVGVTADYGPAHRLYVLRGYVPDGRGLFDGTRHLEHGDRAAVDDELVMYLTKELKAG
jgi:GNAT superfamily N-acetyltransferase